MKSVLISIRPKWCELIASGKKTVELRKTKPKLDFPFKVYIYCTGGFAPPDSKCFTKGWRGQIIGEFVCDRIFPIRVFNNGTIQNWNYNNLKDSCVPYDDIVMYIGNNRNGYGWHISDLKIYDKTKVLSEFVSDKALCHEDWLYGVYSGGSGSKGNYNSYLNAFRLKRPPQSWCYVEHDGG